MNDINEIKNYWDERAQEHGEEPSATTNDVHMRDIEINYIVKFLNDIKDKKRVLDIGCGNGFSTLRFLKGASHHRYAGADYSEKMIANARKSLSALKGSNDLSFQMMDVTQLSSYGVEFDIILTDRCLINLGNQDHQKNALKEIALSLPKGGQFLMIENFTDGQEEMNRMRNQFDLPEIPVRWHNCFFTETGLKEMVDGLFHIDRIENISSLYYLVTRIVYSKLCQIKGKEPDYQHPIHKIASQLPFMGNLGPIKACVMSRT